MLTEEQAATGLTVRAPCVLADQTGKPLAQVLLRQPDRDDPPESVFVVRRGKGELLRYYFNEGGRTVSVAVGDVRLSGDLRTRWLGSERLWIVTWRPWRRQKLAGEHGSSFGFRAACDPSTDTPAAGTTAAFGVAGTRGG